MKSAFSFSLLIIAISTIAQDDLKQQLEAKIQELDSLQQRTKELRSSIEDIKLKSIQVDLNSVGYPSCKEKVEVIHHTAYSLGYDEKHEQARWVMHAILPDIATGNVSRTNDFRVDPLVSTGTAVKADYWYSGYDRGHLAPSADFRWSQKALSESYFYSNMAPQKPELNREKWAELENLIRDYVLKHNEKLYVVTGGILTEGLPTMQNEGRKNEVSIPEVFYKVIMDTEGKDKRAIGFLVPNGTCNYPIMSYAVSVDSVESITGIDFFNGISGAEELEKNIDIKAWQSGATEGEAVPFNPTELPKGRINTVQAQYNIGSKSCVCGTVVSTKYSEKSGATFLNLDKKFPNQIFSVTIWKNARTNFSYLPEKELKGKKVCISGKIEDKNGTPTMNISNEKAILILED